MNVDRQLTYKMTGLINFTLFGSVLTHKAEGVPAATICIDPGRVEWVDIPSPSSLAKLR